MLAAKDLIPGYIGARSISSLLADMYGSGA